MRLKSCVFAIVFLVSFIAVAEPDYSIQQKWNLSGPGGWGALLLDAPSQLLYVPRTNRVAVMDTATGQEVGEIGGVVDARAIALNTSGEFGYITDIADGKAGFLRVFNQSTRQVIASVPAGKNPDAVVYDPATNMVVVFGRHDRSALVIDAKTNQVIATMALPGVPSNAVADGRGNVFVTIEDKGQVVRIAVKSARSTANWTLPGCVGPTGLALDARSRRLFTLCENSKFVVTRSDNGAHISSITTGAGPGTVVFDPTRKLVFIADGVGQLTVVQQKNTDRYAVKQTLDVVPGSHVLAVDPYKDKAYLMAAEYGQRTDDVSEELRLRPTPVAGKCSVIVVSR
jgi:DNA-binding beta-propeller fold protein YncE